MKKILTISITFFFAFTLTVFAQEIEEEKVETKDYYNMSLEELMDMKIVSVSKKEESNFESPLSSSVVTKAMIENSGVTSIPEALALVPGVIVRKQTNGVYDVQIRGMDFLPPKSELVNASNNATLVMIDNRIVFRDFRGGTFWEALPIDLLDVERIEVIRGPASALYGPNAANGVINIITKGIYEEGFHGAGSATVGTQNTQIYKAKMLFNVSNITGGVSGNYQKRDRFTDQYWDYTRDDYVQIDSVISSLRRSPAFATDSDVRYPTPSLALDRYGVNAFVNYQPNSEVSVDVTAGLQESTVQKVYADIGNTPFTTEKSNSKYLNVRALAYKADLQVSYEEGNHNTLGVLGWDLDYTNLNSSLEYDLSLFDGKLELRPGLMYRNVTYDDTKSLDNYGSAFMGGGKRTLTTSSVFLKTEIKPVEPLRIVGAVRAEKYNYPQDVHISYHVGVNYEINENHLVRVLTSKANRGPNFIDTYMDFSAFRGLFNFKGNINTQLVSTQLFEVGYRAMLMKNLQLDLEVFNSYSEGYTSMAIDSTIANPNPPFFPYSYSSVTDLALKAEQLGATVQLKYLLNKHVELVGYGTVQNTELKDYDEYAGDNTQDSLVNITHKWTPNVFGGAYLNFILLDEKLNINLNPTYIGAQEAGLTNGASDTIESMFLLNAAVSYKFFSFLSANLSVRGIGSGGKRQFIFTDPISEQVFLSLKARF